MDEDTHEQELKEQERKNKKELKKRNKKERKRSIKEIVRAVSVMARVLDRITRVEDMNLRCYMLLDKFALMMDIGSLAIADIPEEAQDKLNHHLATKQKEIAVLMDWVMGERQIPHEMANPIPETNNSSERTERRRRNRE